MFKNLKYVNTWAICKGPIASIDFVSTTTEFSTTISARYPHSILTSSKITGIGFSISIDKPLFLKR